MITVKGIYTHGRIQLANSLELEENSEVIITFLDSESTPPTSKEEQDDAYYEGLRAHKRFKATGQITLIDNHTDQESAYDLNDYSAGGLSFFADHTFDTDQLITATFKYDAAGEILVMEFEMQVRRVVDRGDQFLIGCQFMDNVDEELWHTVMGT